MKWELIFSLSAFFVFPLLFLMVSVFLTVPKSVEYFQKLKHSHKSRDFTEMVGSIIISFIFLSLAYISWTYFFLHYESYLKSDVLKVATELGLVGLVFIYFVPQIYHYFRRWKETHRPIHFSFMTFFGFMSLLFLSMVYIKIFFSGVQSV